MACFEAENLWFNFHETKCGDKFKSLCDEASKIKIPLFSVLKSLEIQFFTNI